MQAVDTRRPSGALPALGLVVLAATMGIASAALGPLAVLPIFGLVFLALIIGHPEYGIALFLSTFLMSYPKALQGVGYLTLNNVLGAIFAILLTYKVYREQDWWFLRCPEIQIFLGIILAYYLSDRFNSPDPMKVSLLGAGFYVAEGLRTFINRVAFTLFFVVYIRTPGHVRMIFLLALGFMIMTALTGVQGVIEGGGLKGYRAFTGAEDLVAGQAGVIRSAGNPNRLAMFSVLGISGLWFLMQSLRSIVLKLLIVPNIVVLALAVFMTASRSGLLGLAICVIAIVIDSGLDLRRILTIGLSALALVAIVGQFVPQRSLDRITNLSQSGEGGASLEHRQYTLDLGLEMFRDSPIFGVGMGNWAVARFVEDPGRSAGSAHDSYLLALVEGGIFALLGFLLLLWRTWRNLRVAERYVTTPGFPLSDLTWMIKSSKVNLLVLVFFSMVADLWNLVILFMLIGFGVVMRRMVEQAAEQEASAY